jgi:hypothetical protein
VSGEEHERKTSDAEGGICFSRAISERAACGAGGKARQRGLESGRKHERKTSDAEGGICFSRAISEGAACEAGGEARQRGLESGREHESTKEKQATQKGI